MEPAKGFAAHSLPRDSSGINARQSSQAGLHSLRISGSEVEQLCGLEANDLWVGSLWAGAYRFGALGRSPLSFLVTELLVIALAAMVSLPLGLLLVRNPASADPAAARAAIPFVITVATGMVSLLLLRHRRMAWNRQRWRSLLGILDEIDRYHETLKAVAFLNQLQRIHPPGPINPVNPDINPGNVKPGIGLDNAHTTHSDLDPTLDPATFEALALTRDSLVTGLLADRLLRQQQSKQGNRSRYIDLLEHLDQNLATLTAFDASQQVTEAAQLLQDALQISVAVRHSLLESHLLVADAPFDADASRN